MAVRLIALVQGWSPSPQSTQVPGLAVLANPAQFAGGLLFLLAAVVKLLAVGKRGTRIVPALDIVTAPAATAIAVLELLGGFFLAHAQCGRIVPVFAYLYGPSGLSHLLAFNRPSALWTLRRRQSSARIAKVR